ncbi:TPA: hypothetical protein U1X84_002438, partial [Streptococcus suis]|nr:hypothetical protein [Streptococcus suis]
KNNSAQNLCSGFGGKKEKLEEYYENYINFIIGDKNDNTIEIYISYEELFESNEQLPSGELPHSRYYQNLWDIISNSRLSKTSFESIIDCDMYYFGLIYLIIFEKKVIDSQNWPSIKEKLNKQISDYKAPYLDKQGIPTYDHLKGVYSSYHQKNPSALKYLRERVEKSIEIYREYGL